MIPRVADGRFRKVTADDVGIGVCPECKHITVRPEETDEIRDRPVAPDRFRLWNAARICPHCGWTSPEAQAVGATELPKPEPKKSQLGEWFREIAEQEGL